MNLPTPTPAAGFEAPQATWDQRFSAPDYIFGTTPNAFLASQASRLMPGMKALAVADGEGRNGVWLAQQGLQVQAFDISPVGVEKARSLAAQAGVRIDASVCAVEDWIWTPAVHDVVVAIFIQFAPPELRARVFAGMLATLKPGGLLILQGYTPRQLEYKTGGPPRVDHLYTADLLRESFAGQDFLELREHDAVLAEGRQHTGVSALIDCVLRKRA